MKVLWFSNTPANSDEFLKTELKGPGGWLKALDQEMQKEVNLHIAFLGSNNHPFKYKNTTYYPIIINIRFINKVLGKCFNSLRQANYLNAYLKIIDCIEPDIIHIHGTESSFGEIIGKTSIPIVLSIQGNITVYRHKYFCGIEERYIKRLFDKANVIRSLLFGNNIQAGYKSFSYQSNNEKRYLAKCNYIIGRTDWDRRVTFILSPHIKYFHCDEILRDSFYVNEWRPNNNETGTIIHTTSGNHIYKGLETICYALNLLNLNGYNVEWRIAGVSANDLIVSLVKRKMKKGYPTKGLVFLGNLTEDQLIRKMLEADIYVMPSHIENSPNSLCEAMILGMPCISTLAGGTSSLLKDKDEGILIQDGDPWVLAGAIEELNQDSNGAAIYGLNARKKALIRHNKEKIINELMVIYNKVINL